MWLNQTEEPFQDGFDAKERNDLRKCPANKKHICIVNLKALNI